MNLQNKKPFKTNKTKYSNKNIEQIIFLSQKKYLLLKIITLLVILILLLSIFYKSNLDLFLQQYFFDSNLKEWLIDRNSQLPRIIFYQIPKIILGIVIITSFFLAGKIAFNNRNTYTYKSNLELYRYLYIGSSILFVVLIVANIKKFTNIPCPNQIIEFGGSFHYQKIFSLEMQPMQVKRFQCFPAGHATVGFAFYSLIYLAKKIRLKVLIFLFATIYGWLTGIYQIAKGAHFISDTFVTMLMSFILATTFALFYRNFFDKNYRYN